MIRKLQEMATPTMKGFFSWIGEGGFGGTYGRKSHGLPRYFDFLNDWWKVFRTLAGNNLPRSVRVFDPAETADRRSPAILGTFGRRGIVAGMGVSQGTGLEMPDGTIVQIYVVKDNLNAEPTHRQRDVYWVPVPN